MVHTAYAGKIAPLPGRQEPGRPGWYQNGKPEGGETALIARTVFVATTLSIAKAGLAFTDI
jgi:hypothetical protein